MCQPLSEYRYKRANHLLSSTPQSSSTQQATVPVGSTSDILVQSHVGCTPLVEAIQSDEICQMKRKRLIKKEGENLLQSTPPSTMTRSGTTPATVSSTLTTPVSRSSSILKKDETKSVPSAEKENNNNMESVAKHTTPVSLSSSCVRKRDSSIARPESLDIRKLRQAQRKEEWQKKHTCKQKSVKEGGPKGKGAETVMADRGSGGDALITDGTYDIQL